MKTLTIPTYLALSLGVSGAVNASSYLFNDSPAESTRVSDSDEFAFTSSVVYKGLDGPITSVFLTILLSEDPGSPRNFIDTAVGYAKLTVGGRSLTSAEIDGNNVPGTFRNRFRLLSTIAPEIDANTTAGFKLRPRGPEDTPNPAPGYFNDDVTNLPSGISGTLDFDLYAVDTIKYFKTIPFVYAGRLYREDFNYEGAELTIETSPVPVPRAFWLVSS